MTFTSCKRPFHFDQCPSKHEMRRIARSTKAIALPKLQPPTLDEIGKCDVVNVEEIGSTKCIIFKQEQEGSRVATIVVRGSTTNVQEDVERCVDDAVHNYRGMSRVRTRSLLGCPIRTVRREI